MDERLEAADIEVRYSIDLETVSLTASLRGPKIEPSSTMTKIERSKLENLSWSGRLLKSEVDLFRAFGIHVTLANWKFSELGSTMYEVVAGRKDIHSNEERKVLTLLL